MRFLLVFALTLAAGVVGCVYLVTPPSLPPPLPGAGPTEERRVAGTLLRLPIAEGHCALDRRDPGQRALFERLIGGIQGAPAMVTLPCGRAQELHAAGQPPVGLRFVVMGQIEGVLGVPVARGADRAATLARLRSAFPPGWRDERRAAQAGVSMRLYAEHAGMDADMVQLRSRVRIDSATQIIEICGIYALTEAAGAPFGVTVLENCNAGGLTAAARDLVRRLALANPPRPV